MKLSGALHVGGIVVTSLALMHWSPGVVHVVLMLRVAGCCGGLDRLVARLIKADDLPLTVIATAMASEPLFSNRVHASVQVVLMVTHCQ